MLAHSHFWFLVFYSEGVIQRMNRLIKVVCSTVFVPNPSAFLTFLMNDLSLRGLFCHTFELLVSIL